MNGCHRQHSCHARGQFLLRNRPLAFVADVTHNAGMKRPAYTGSSKVVRWPGDAAWHFLGVDKITSTAIKAAYRGPRRGFGAVPVVVTIGATTWQTSIFPDKRSGCYLLPLKAAVRKKEELDAGETCSYTLRLFR